MTDTSHTIDYIYLKKLLASPEGRWFVRKVLFEFALVQHSAMTMDDRTTAYENGRRAVGLSLQALITEHEPLALGLLHQEEKPDA